MDKSLPEVTMMITEQMSLAGYNFFGQAFAFPQVNQQKRVRVFSTNNVQRIYSEQIYKNYLQKPSHIMF